MAGARWLAGPGVIPRAVAAAIDGAAALALAVLLSTTSGTYFARRAVEAFRIGSPETLWKGPVPMIGGLLG